jgi:hypothetical protein
MKLPGISEEFALEAGFEERLNPEPHLFIPYYDRNGKLTGHYRWRLYNKRANGQKYYQKPGSIYLPYFCHLPLVRCKILLLTEGEKKALALAEAGWQVIGLPGLSCYQKDADGNPQILPALYEAITFVQPEVIYFIGDADTVSNLEYFRSAGILAEAFPGVQVRLIATPLGGPKGIDDLKGELDGQFPEWMMSAQASSIHADPEASFLVAARLALEGSSERIKALPPAQREHHLERIIQMSALARLSKEPRFSVSRFLSVGWKISGLTKPDFERSVSDRIDRMKQACPELVEPPPPDGTTPIPNSWPSAFDFADFTDALFQEFTNPRLIVMTDAQAVVCTIHTISTYLTEYIDDWLHFLYITAGAKDSGKTKLMLLFFGLVYRADLSGNPSAASIYYALQDGIYTIMIDEVDKNEARREAVLDLLNFSTSRDTAWVARADPEKGTRKKYPTFCPKIIAGNGSLRDTAESRCIRILMRKKPPGSPRVRITKTDRARFGVHREKMMRLAQTIGPDLRDYDEDTLLLPSQLMNREADNWMLLFIITELIGGHWTTLLQGAFRELNPPRAANEADDTSGNERELGEPLVRDLARIWMETRSRTFFGSEVLRAKLRTFTDRPWVTMNHGMGLSVEKLSSLLRDFGVRSVQHQHSLDGSNQRQRGYFLGQLESLFYSYASDIWDKSEPDASGSSDSSKTQEVPEKEAIFQEPLNREVEPVHPVPPPGDQVPEPIRGGAQVFEENGGAQVVIQPPPSISASESTDNAGVHRGAQVVPPNQGVNEMLIPPSTTKRGFRRAK